MNINATRCSPHPAAAVCIHMHLQACGAKMHLFLRLGRHCVLQSIAHHHRRSFTCQRHACALAMCAAVFKQQNSVRGLPLELSPEEVTLGLEKGERG